MLGREIFSRSARLSKFLRFAVERTLEDDADALKEYSLGLEVFDRDETYDPRIDPIVRVEARRLRNKIKQYYEQDGADEEVRIALPKGAYVPVFLRHSVDGQEEASSDSGRPAVDPEALASLDRKSLAVLPFLALSPDEETAGFADGLSEDLIYALSGVSDLKVTSRTSAFSFKGSQQDVQEIGLRLQVRLVVEGSVRRAGNRLRVTARLVDVVDDAQLWSDRFDRDLEDVFVIQDEIASSIVRVLKVKVRGEETRSIVRQRTASLKAYGLYLKGREFWGRRNQGGLPEGVRHFEQAIADDPSYATACAGLVECYSLYEVYEGRSPNTFMPQALEAAQKALEADASLAEAQAAVGVVETLYGWNWSRAESAFEQALRLSPAAPAARQWYGRLLTGRGRFEEALAEMRAARDLDPLSPTAYFGVGFVRYYAGRFEEAENTLERTLLLDSAFEWAHEYLGRTFLALGEPGKAVAAFELTARIASDKSTLGDLRALALAASGDRAAAKKELKRLEAEQKKGRPTAYAIAAARLGLDDADGALEALEMAVEQRSRTVHLLAVDPILASLRSEPRFERLVASIQAL